MNNELDYFKNQAFKLFEENKRGRVEIKLLKKRVEDFRNEQECLDVVMQKLRKKWMREKEGKSKEKGKRCRRRDAEGDKGNDGDEVHQLSKKNMS